MARLCHEVNAPRYTDVRAIQTWLAQTQRVLCPVSGLMELLPRLGFTYKLTKPASCQANGQAQAGFLDELRVREAPAERGASCSIRPMRRILPTTPAAPAPGAKQEKSAPCSRSVAASR